MQITRYSDYSLRVLMYLALAPERRVRIEDIARSFAISKAHLTKVVHELGLRGYVTTVRGRGGGLRLGRRAERIGVGEVVRATEENLDLVECFDPATSRCAIEQACGLRSPLDEALAAFFAVLDRYTIADLVARRRTPLARLLDSSTGRVRAGAAAPGRAARRDHHREAGAALRDASARPGRASRRRRRSASRGR